MACFPPIILSPPFDADRRARQRGRANTGAAPMIRRLLVLAYGVASYALFFATFLYTVGFIGNLVVPKGIDAAPRVALWQALLVNAGLLLVFALQHSVMA